MEDRVFGPADETADGVAPETAQETSEEERDILRKAARHFAGKTRW